MNLASSVDGLGSDITSDKRTEMSITILLFKSLYECP